MTKGVRFSDDAYRRPKARKRQGESFSDVVKRLTTRTTLADLEGTMTPAQANRAKRRIRQTDEQDQP